MKNKFKLILSIFTVFSIFVSIFSMCVSAEDQVLNQSYSKIAYRTPNGIFRVDTINPPSNYYGTYTVLFQELENDDIIERVPEYHEGFKIDYSTIPTTVSVEPGKVNVYYIDYYDENPVLNQSYSKILYRTPNGVFRTDTIYPPSDYYGTYTVLFQELENDDIIERVPASYNGFKIDYSTVPTSVVVEPDKINVYYIDYYDEEPVLNQSYSKIFYRTPEGIFRTDTINAPSNYYGTYSVLFQELENDDIIERVPEYHDGFKIDYSTVPLSVIVQPDKVNNYYIDYTGDGKIVNINYYDPYGVFIRNVQYTVDINATSFTIPTNQQYLYAPLKLDLSMGIPEQAFTVYQIDFQGQRDEAYQSGFKDGSDYGLRDLAAQLKESYDNGYNKGFEDGFDDGSVITGAERNEIAKDYNAITGFFDGIYNTIFGSIDYIFDGIGLGGVTLGEVVWTLVIVFVVVLIVRKMF